MDTASEGKASLKGYACEEPMLGYVKTAFAEVGKDCELRVLDQRRPARIITESPYDPDNKALRA